MSLATKPPVAQRRVWRAPISNARWLWLGVALFLYILCLAWYVYAVRTQPFAGPFTDPLRLFGILAFVLVLSTAAYSLRRRFARGLPGKVQDWLWMHTWIGISTILLAMLHENFTHLTHDYCQNLSCFTNVYWGTSALFALIFLVGSGIIGRLLDVWQAHTIAHEASTNGVGIASALEERILELEYIVERLCAGKSEAFKAYCMQGIEGATQIAHSIAPLVGTDEQNDLQRASETLINRSRLVQSLRHQRQARTIIRTWRTIHIVLACLALVIILYHGIMELLSSVFHLIR